MPQAYFQERSRPSELIEIGNIQLWLKTPYERSNGIPTPDEQGDTERRSSNASSPSPFNRRMSLSAPSIMSTVSAGHTQQITLGSSQMAIELTQPSPPLLVLFLKQPDTGQLSFLVVELDECTKVEPNSCNCRSSREACAISVLERSGSPLLARRFYANNGLNSWNLAAIGENWSARESEAVHVQNMYWLRIGFESEAERIKFNNDVTTIIRLFTTRIAHYQRDLMLIRGTHIISQVG